MTPIHNMAKNTHFLDNGTKLFGFKVSLSNATPRPTGCFTWRTVIVSWTNGRMDGWTDGRMDGWEMSEETLQAVELPDPRMGAIP